MVTQQMESYSTALIRIDPLADPAVSPMVIEAQKLREYAVSRVITSSTDVTLAVEDLATMATLKKAIKNKYDEYTKPINGYLKDIKGTFDTINIPLADADTITRKKVSEYQAEQERKRQEIEDINRMREEAARREAAINDGEITEDVNILPVPEAVSNKVHTDVGSMGTMKVRKWRITNVDMIPRQYMLINESLVTQLVKKGIPEIPGIEIYEETVLRINTK